MKKLLVFAFFFGTLLANWEEKIDINGYFNFEFEQQIGGDEGTLADEHGSFDADMFNIVFNIRPTDRVRVAADLTWEHGPQTEIEKGNVGSEYAFAEYTVNNSLRVRGGKMFTAFGIYNELHTAKPTTIVVKEPNPTNKIYFLAKNGTVEQTMLYPRWASGVALLGDSYVGNMPFDYIIQMTNGDLDYANQDENQYDKDDNDGKALGGRIRADVTSDLQVGFSFYRDRLNHYKKISGDWEKVANKDVLTFGTQMIWHVTDRFRFEAEYVNGSVDIDASSDKQKFNRWGLQVLPSFLITDKLNLFLQLTAGDPNSNIDKDRVYSYAPGINYELDNNVYIKSDIYTVLSKENNSLLKGKDSSEFRAVLAVGF